MKKILIPIIGLLVLIFLTPFILGRMANSNIDDKINELKQQGMIIKEVSKDIGYLNTKREFKVILNRKFKNKTWQKYYKFIHTINANIILKFKNLPITKADMDIIGDIKILKTRLKNIKLHLVTKNFKDFEYQLVSIKDFKIENFKGVAHKKKYTQIDMSAKTLDYKNLFTSQNNRLNGEIKDILLGLVDLDWQVEKWKFKHKSLELKGENSEENLTTHLLGDGKYILEDRFYSEKFGLKNRLFSVAFSNFEWDLKLEKQKDSFENSNIDLNIKWVRTEYQKAIVDGGELSLKLNILNPKLQNYDDLSLVLDLKLEKELFRRVTKDFNPVEVAKYFKDNKTHIEIKNGEILVNGNRIQ